VNVELQVATKIKLNVVRRHPTIQPVNRQEQVLHLPLMF